MSVLIALIAVAQAQPITPTATPAQQVMHLTNEFRTLKRRKPLVWNERLERAAHAHAADIAEMEYFSHRSLNGDELKNRIDRQGYAWSTIGENIARGQRDAAIVTKAWQDSPGHRRNMLDPEFTEIGIAVVQDGEKQNVWVMVLGAPMK